MEEEIKVLKEENKKLTMQIEAHVQYKVKNECQYLNDKSVSENKVVYDKEVLKLEKLWEDESDLINNEREDMENLLVKFSQLFFSVEMQELASSIIKIQSDIHKNLRHHHCLIRELNSIEERGRSRVVELNDMEGINKDLTRCEGQIESDKKLLNELITQLETEINKQFITNKAISTINTIETPIRTSNSYSVNEETGSTLNQKLKQAKLFLSSIQSN